MIELQPTPMSAEEQLKIMTGDADALQESDDPCAQAIAAWLAGCEEWIAFLNRDR
ncbi:MULTISPECIES: hypothetical protein [unclassified Sphingobium]|uniref:hypothetical protein n=1 Tax=unclassified Sphingobium TaxID=2611147 RepID=UPI000AED6D10|nr:MULTISPECIES: hypothetical protein [unclassified Sphingobium]